MGPGGIPGPPPPRCPPGQSLHPGGMGPPGPSQPPSKNLGLRRACSCTGRGGCPNVCGGRPPWPRLRPPWPWLRPPWPRLRPTGQWKQEPGLRAGIGTAPASGPGRGGSSGQAPGSPRGAYARLGRHWTPPGWLCGRVCSEAGQALGATRCCCCRAGDRGLPVFARRAGGGGGGAAHLLDFQALPAGRYSETVLVGVAHRGTQVPAPPCALSLPVLPPQPAQGLPHRHRCPPALTLMVGENSASAQPVASSAAGWAGRRPARHRGSTLAAHAHSECEWRPVTPPLGLDSSGPLSRRWGN